MTPSRSLLASLLLLSLGILSPDRGWSQDTSLPGRTASERQLNADDAVEEASVAQSSRKSAPPARLANPLWTIPLASLAPTRERPIFSPSRRPPAVALPSARVYQAPPPTRSDEQPRKPPFVLVGAIAGDREEIALFLDDNTKAVVRLRTGQSHSGWTLRSVKGRQATLEGFRQTTTLALPDPLSRPAGASP
jgi:general secretion pathway protein N